MALIRLNLSLPRDRLVTESMRISVRRDSPSLDRFRSRNLNVTVAFGGLGGGSVRSRQVRARLAAAATAAAHEARPETTMELSAAGQASGGYRGLDRGGGGGRGDGKRGDGKRGDGSGARLVDAWLASSQDGYCATTEEGEGDCVAGTQGSFKLPHLDGIQIWSWRPAAAYCLDRCARCPRCVYVTLSLEDFDCSWYTQCNLRALHTDLGQSRFKSSRVPRARVLSAAVTGNLSMEVPPTAPGYYSEEAIVAVSSELERPRVRRALDHWLLSHSRHGVCAQTNRLDEGDCTIGDRGVFELRPCEARTWRTAAASCLARCGACSRCAYVSVVRLPGASECHWFAAEACAQRFERLPRERGKETGLPAAGGATIGWGARTGLARLSGAGWSEILSAAHLPATFGLARPRTASELRQQGEVAMATLVGKGVPRDSVPRLVAPLPADVAQPVLARTPQLMARAKPRACAAGWASPLAGGSSNDSSSDEDTSHRLECSTRAMRASGAWLVVESRAASARALLVTPSVVPGFAGSPRRQRRWLLRPCAARRAVGVDASR